jgi:type I restriction enzyme R subunit
MAARSELFRIFLENQEFQNFLVERVINAARTMVRGAAG